MELRVAVSGVLGAIVGAIVFSVLTVLWHMVFAPELLSDGQYIFIFIGTIPAGAVLGCFTVPVFVTADTPRLSQHIAWLGGLAGFVSVAALVLIGIVGLSGPQDLMPVWGHGILWSMGLLLWGWKDSGA